MLHHLPRFWCGAHVNLKGTDFVNAGAVGAGPSGRGRSPSVGSCGLHFSDLTRRMKARVKLSASRRRMKRKENKNKVKQIKCTGSSEVSCVLSGLHVCVCV